MTTRAEGTGRHQETRAEATFREQVLITFAEIPTDHSAPPRYYGTVAAVLVLLLAGLVTAAAIVNGPDARPTSDTVVPTVVPTLPPER